MSEAVINIIKHRLAEMGCTDITVDSDPGKVVARFNCTELTSFNRPIEGWIPIGIELNDKAGQSYKITFLKAG